MNEKQLELKLDDVISEQNHSSKVEFLGQKGIYFVSLAVGGPAAGAAVQPGSGTFPIDKAARTLRAAATALSGVVHGYRRSFAAGG